ncbi:dNTP triphosphohydrolase [Schnuerera sp. xch1]|uniref:dGTP triphosphohydrolase n=1 Tax=Schnuerera sp. xch1 TaxID=2874283 RepID=UPI001CC027CC|nr:dNTP triphosphohydrolase [Schnuerera sp. xch1]MBZ2174075.1 dNTP triphosphohydrolase [Schnuerera sp. xch1]
MFIEGTRKGLDLEKRENKNIYDWGIKHKEDSQYKSNYEETNRTDFRRQRDRILYTGGFRRLANKTQVIASTKNGDHRTRLTHTLEVEQIAVSIADALGLNRDLVSAISLGHDIGHTPFGHAVEKILNNKLKDIGGFSHAVQSIRYLETQAYERKGANLSDEILEGILKHDSDVYAGGYNEEQFNCEKFSPLKPGSLESQTVFWADKLAYITHDFEDFFKNDIYKHAIDYDETLENRLKDILCSIINVEDKCNAIKKDISNFENRDLIRNLLTNLINKSWNNLKNLKNTKSKINPIIIRNETEKRIKDNERDLVLDRWKTEKETKDKDIKKEAYQRGLLINFSDDYYEYYKNLRDVLDEYYIRSPEVARSDDKAKKIVESLFKDFNRETKLLPLNIQKEIDKNKLPKERIIADYISSMTDKYAEEICSNLNSIGSYYEY